MNLEPERELKEYEPSADVADELNISHTLRSLDVAPEKVERYGIHPDQYIEWYGSSAGSPVCLIHGGYFHEDGTLSYLRPAACALGEAGYSVALVEYRREEGNQEVSFNDIEKLAEHPRLARAVWVGHSAGAVFALHALFADTNKVKHAVVLSPIFDLARAAQEDLGKSSNPTLRWMKGLPSEIPAAYQRWEPMEMYRNMGADGFRDRDLRLDVIHGAQDQTVPVARTRDLIGEPFNFAIVPHENHNDAIRPGSDSWFLLLGCLG